MSHRGAPKKKNRHHYVAAGGEAASPAPLLVIAKHQTSLTQLAHVSLDGPAAQSQDGGHAVYRGPGSARFRVAVIE
jgi:hypothetical protein